MREFMLFFLIGVTAADFTGHRLVSIHARDRGDLDFLNSLADSPEFEGLDFWTDLSIYRPVEVRVTPNDYGRLQQVLRNVGITYDVINENIQTMIDEESRSMKKARADGFCDPITSYCDFHLIEGWLASKANNNPTRMQIAEDMNTPKEAIWIEAGTHAREWIAVSSALNLIEKLLDTSDSLATEMLSRYDWYIAPVHNPDGYAYSHAHNDNRLWRKNRQACRGSGIGTDLNRNWDANFGGTGASPFCSSSTYHGTEAFSAPETAALRDAVLSTQDVKAFFSVHCYSQFMLIPYGYTETHPGRYDHLFDVSNEMMKQLETVDGQYYITGTPPDILYAASGGAYDYFYRQDIPYSYTYELRPVNGTYNGFVLDSTHIPKAAQELFMSLWAFATMDNLNRDKEISHP